jgi:hypothetical protein
MAARVVPVIAAIALLKIVIHYYNLEFLQLSALFTALISANIFLIGFNISGVLSDFKSGEKMPGELAASIEAITDECVYIYKSKKTAASLAGFNYCVDFTSKCLQWLYKKVRTRAIMKDIEGFTDVFLALETVSQSSFIGRLKHEQSQIRKTVLRIHAIREIRFSEAAYAIAEIMSFIMVMGMIFLKLDPFYECLFFTVFVAFIFIYMLLLIRDLDDPFAYYDKKHSVEEISLHSLEDLKLRLEHRSKELN